MVKRLPVLAAGCILLGGCSLIPASWRRVPSIQLPSGKGKVIGPVNPGTPPTVHQTDSGTTLPLAAGSKVTFTKTEAVPATADIPAKPAVEVVEVVPAGPTELRRTETALQASAGTVDTSVAKAEIRAKESRPLLYAAIAAALGVGFFIWQKYPTGAFACGISALVFFLAWKVSDLPGWFYTVGIAAAAFALALYLGHEKGEQFAQSKPTPQS